MRPSRREGRYRRWRSAGGRGRRNGFQWTPPKFLARCLAVHKRSRTSHPGRSGCPHPAFPAWRCRKDRKRCHRLRLHETSVPAFCARRAVPRHPATRPACRSAGTRAPSGAGFRRGRASGCGRPGPRLLWQSVRSVLRRLRDCWTRSNGSSGTGVGDIYLRRDRIACRAAKCEAGDGRDMWRETNRPMRVVGRWQVLQRGTSPVKSRPRRDFRDQVGRRSGIRPVDRQVEHDKRRALVFQFGGKFCQRRVGPGPRSEPRNALAVDIEHAHGKPACAARIFVRSGTLALIGVEQHAAQAAGESMPVASQKRKHNGQRNQGKRP